MIKISQTGTLLLLVLFSSRIEAASFNVSGDYRFGSNLFNRLNLQNEGDPGHPGTTAFLEHRLLLRPDVVVDDRFIVRSEINFMQMGQGNPNAGPEGFGTPLDSRATFDDDRNILVVRKAYVEWLSDFGIFRAGRQAKQWGLGILYDDGLDAWDDFATHRDRIGYQALIGSLSLNIGYEKLAEHTLYRQIDDAQSYEVSVDYSSPEELFDVGLLYSRRIRQAGAGIYQNSSHDMSIFARKKWGDFLTAFEFVTIRPKQTPTATGLLFQNEYRPGSFRMGLDIAFASGNDTISYNFHPNYRPFMLMFKESVGTGVHKSFIRGGPNGVPVGSAVGAGSGNGAFVSKLKLEYGFSDDKYVLAGDLGYARLTNQGTNDSKTLGFETDIHLDHKWYENFKSSYALGLLFPGSGYGRSSNVTWGVQLRGALSF